MHLRGSSADPATFEAAVQALDSDWCDGAMNLWQQPIAGGPAVPLTRFADERIFRFSASPDRKRWAIVRGTIASDVVLVSERE